MNCSINSSNLDITQCVKLGILLITWTTWTTRWAVIRHNFSFYIVIKVKLISTFNSSNPKQSKREL